MKLTGSQMSNVQVEVRCPGLEVCEGLDEED